METVTFSYQGKQYNAGIICSTHQVPHFYWLVINDSQLMKLVDDDCICFQQVDGKLVCTSLFLATRQPELVEIARATIEKFIA